MEVYFRVFINYEQSDYAKLLLIARFTYNNTKNINITYIFFELNYGYHLYIFCKKNINFYSKSISINRLLTKLQELITIYRENIYCFQEFQKQA